MIGLDVTMRRRPEVTSRDTPEGAVLLDLASGNCYELNRVGQMFWSELSSIRPLARICDSLLAKLNAPRDVVERDVLALVEDLQRAGLVDMVRPATP